MAISTNQVGTPPGNKEIIARNPQTTAVYRFIGRIVYMKMNNLEYAQPLIDKIVQKGGKVETNKGWIRADIIGDNKIVRFGQYEINVDTQSETEIQNMFVEFFTAILKQSGFICEIKDI